MQLSITGRGYFATGINSEATRIGEFVERSVAARSELNGPYLVQSFDSSASFKVAEFKVPLPIGGLPDMALTLVELIFVLQG